MNTMSLNVFNFNVLNVCFQLFLVGSVVWYVPQTSAQERTMRTVNFVKKSVTPIAMKCNVFEWHNNHLYCIDYERQVIAMVEIGSGHVQQEFGRKGTGTSPGEFKGLFHSIADSSGIVGVDIAKGTLTEFDYQGKVTREYKHPTQIMYAARLSATSQYVVKPLEPFENNKEQFQIVNVSTQTRQPVFATAQVPPPDVASLFASFIRSQTQSVYFNGPMVNNNAGVIVRVSTYCNEFVAFDAHSGRVLYGRQTIDPSGKWSAPKISTDLSTMRRINLAATANAQYLFVLSNAPSSPLKDAETNLTDERVVDAYNIRNGDYTMSFVLPNHNGKRARGLQMTKEDLWVLYDHEIVQYQYQLP